MVKKVSPELDADIETDEEEDMIDDILEREMSTLEEFMAEVEERYTNEEEVFADEIELGELWFTVIPEKIPEEEVD
jgi:hypothetical protein